ncbi:hypothetical protein Pint_16608 [Pistacia integerrima]|uniref:Uncharacterized protein n=1 Tax=Pistacia integerrima TaxID=434235 RepID=A0ACC0ZEF8_9ROSI|nr:hypothetical protein Pint_16608 [Pistacia integerrima]
MEEVEVAKKRCKNVIDQIERLPSSTNITRSSKQTLSKLALSELNFLSRSSVTLPLSVNIGHLEAVLYVLQHPLISGVSRVCKPIKSGFKSVHVDLVCTFDKIPVWILVSDRNPKYVSWNEYHKSKGSKSRVEEVLAAARSCGTLRPRKVILFFSHGVGDFVRDHLRGEFGALEISLFEFDSCEEEEDAWVHVLSRSFHEACVFEINVDFSGNDVSSSECGVKDATFDTKGSNVREEIASLNLGGSFGSLVSQMKLCSMGEPDHLLSEGDLVNFDTTALIALVSGISNGCAEKLLATSEIELRQQFKGNVQFVIAQVTFYSVLVTLNILAHKVVLYGMMNTFLAKLVDCHHFWIVIARQSFGIESLLAFVLMWRLLSLCHEFESFYYLYYATFFLIFSTNKVCQAMSELQNPICEELGGVLAGKRGIICESVLSEFKELVLMCGGPNEKLRSNQLLKYFIVVNDSPSERLMGLPTTRKLALKNKVVFGTGDCCHAPTLTANMAFVRAVSQTGMSLSTIEHRPRALTGD